MTFGLTNDGFIKKKLTDVRQDIIDDITATVGPIDTEPTSVFSQHIDPFSEAASLLWDLSEDVYNAFRPSAATGSSLDDLLDINNLTRLASTPSIVPVALRGAPGTLVPGTTTKFRQDGTNEVFTQTADVTLSVVSAIEAVITITTVTIATVYELTIDAITISIVSTTANETSILQQIANEIQTATSSEFEGEVVDLTLVITPVDGRTAFSYASVTNVSLSLIASEGTASADIAGALSVPIDTLINIETPVPSLDSVRNLVVGTTGRAAETDDEARIRRLTSLSVAGAATDPAIEARLVDDVVNVVSATVVSNRTLSIDGEGRPPKSYEAIVTGGLDQDIFDKLWQIQPSGIESFGNTSGTTPDSQGILQVINFSRPTQLAITVNVEFDSYDEELLPSNFEDAIKQAIVDFSITEQSVSADVIVQRYLSPIYTITGVGVVTTLEMNKPAGPVVSTTIPIASSEIATFDVSNITVTINP